MSETLDTWERLRRLTRARIGLGRAGDGLPTKALLDFQMAHAAARDAVHGAADFDAIAADLAPREVIRLTSATPDRPTYLRRPDLGRRLAEGEVEKLPAGPFDVVFVVADGLSAAAVDANAAATLEATARRLADLSIGPVVLARQARVQCRGDGRLRHAHERGLAPVGGPCRAGPQRALARPARQRSMGLAPKHLTVANRRRTRSVWRVPSHRSRENDRPLSEKSIAARSRAGIGLCPS